MGRGKDRAAKAPRWQASCCGQFDRFSAAVGSSGRQERKGWSCLDWTRADPWVGCGGHRLSLVAATATAVLAVHLSPSMYVIYHVRRVARSLPLSYLPLSHTTASTRGEIPGLDPITIMVAFLRFSPLPSFSAPHVPSIDLEITRKPRSPAAKAER